MGIKFTADEIFEMAEQLERNGAKFYRVAAENFDDAERKKILLDLAVMEDQHEVTFKSMRSELAADEKESSTFDPDDEVAMYLQAMADGHVFDLSVPPSEKLTGKETFVEILKIAIDCEMDSIIFYLGLRELVSTKAGKDKVNAIIREEMGHIALLNKHFD